MSSFILPPSVNSLRSQTTCPDFQDAFDLNDSNLSNTYLTPIDLEHIVHEYFSIIPMDQASQPMEYSAWQTPERGVAIGQGYSFSLSCSFSDHHPTT